MKKLDKNFQVDVSGCTPEEVKEMAEFAAGELGCGVWHGCGLKVFNGTYLKLTESDKCVFVGGCNHRGKQELPLEDFRAMMNEKAIKPKDLACFKEVADVLGEESTAIELKKVIDRKDCHFGRFLDESLLDSFAWHESPQGHGFWEDIDNGVNPYDTDAESKPNLGHSVLSTIELEKQTAAQKALDEVHCCKTVSEIIARRTTEEPVEFVDMDGNDICASGEEFLEVPMDIASKMSKENAGRDNDNKKTPAHKFLEAGIGHMKNRASERDTEDGERSMKSTVDAFNAVFSDCIVNQGGKMTEEQGWHFMTLLKLSRSKGGYFRQDDYEDAAAYQALAGETASVDRRKK